MIWESSLRDSAYMPKHLSHLEKSIKRAIWKQKNSSVHKSKDLSYRLAKLDLFFSVITTLSSLFCLIGIAFFFGINPGDVSDWILTALHCVLCLFTLNILLGYIFSYDTYVKKAGVLKWLVNFLILINAAVHFLPPLPSPFHYLQANTFLFVSLAGYSIIFLSAKALDAAQSYRLNPTLILASSFLVVIASGTFLLMLPKSTREPLDLIDALFISTSAVCVTGLSPVDISQVFTNFGLLILSCLIQIGGLGLITFTSVFAIFYAGQTSIYNQLLIKDMVYSKTMDALLPTLLYILGLTLMIEAIGAVLIYWSVPAVLFSSNYERGVFAAFHAMSAFCNAGFSNVKDGLSNPVLMNGSQFFYLVICFLMFMGSIGFPILINLKDKLVAAVRQKIGLSFQDETKTRFDLNTKLVLILSAVLTATGAFLFFILEFNGVLKDLPFFSKLVQSLFNSILPRTTGFASVNPADFHSATILMICVLMWIGGSSQSMAGGVKVNTIAVLLLNLKSLIFGSRNTSAFNRTIPHDCVMRAYAVASSSVLAILFFVFSLMLLEPEHSSQAIIFEVISAICTVGSSLGLTPNLCWESKALLCCAMFLGRVGLLSVMIGLFSGRCYSEKVFPDENIIIN